MMNKELDFIEWAINSGHGNTRVPKNLLEIILDYQKHVEAKFKNLDIQRVSGSFLDELIEKHKANKKLALKNCKKMKYTAEYPWIESMIRFIKKKMKAFAIHIVRRSAYYKEINQRYHELWMHTQLNNPEWRKYSKGSLYDGCIKTLENHPQHYA